MIPCHGIDRGSTPLTRSKQKYSNPLEYFCLDPERSRRVTNLALQDQTLLNGGFMFLCLTHKVKQLIFAANTIMLYTMIVFA